MTFTVKYLNRNTLESYYRNIDCEWHEKEAKALRWERKGFSWVRIERKDV